MPTTRWASVELDHHNSLSAKTIVVADRLAATLHTSVYKATRIFMLNPVVGSKNSAQLRKPGWLVVSWIVDILPLGVLCLNS